jgi:hypothetical protein
MCSRPYACSAAKPLCARQSSRRLSGSEPPPLPAGWWWSSSSQAWLPQRAPSALTQLQPSPSRSSSARRAARGTREDREVSGVDLTVVPEHALGRSEAGVSGAFSGSDPDSGDAAGSATACFVALRHAPAPKRRRIRSSMSSSRARETMGPKSPLGCAWRSKSRASSSCCLRAASAVNWIR